MARRETEARAPRPEAADGPEPDELSRALARAAVTAPNLENLVRPLLEALAKIASLESTYLMVFDWDRREQEVRFAWNTGGGEIREGLRIASPQPLSAQTLPGVTRSLENLPRSHPDSQVAKELGLRTYVSVPVVTGEHRLWGMLCGASPEPRQISERVVTVMEFLARLIADNVVSEERSAAEHRAELAEELLRSRAMFLAQAEHELRSPMTVILGSLQSVRSHWDTLSAKHREQHLDAAIQSAKRLIRQVEHLMIEARAEVRARALRPVPLELSGLLESAARAFDSVSPDHAVTAESSERIEALVDPSALYQVLGILLENAIKYSPAGGTIRLRAAAAEEEVVVEVTDEGEGVAENVDIFAPFQRGNREESRAGIGLGLHIARNLVGAMGGAIEARRNPERGSTVTVRLPGVS